MIRGFLWSIALNCFAVTVGLCVSFSNSACQAPTRVLSWGSFGTGPGNFHIPLGITAGPDGTVAVMDHVNQRLECFAADGSYLRAWGRVGRASSDFFGPSGISFDHSGNIVACQHHGGRVQQFTVTGDSIGVWEKDFRGPEDVAVSQDGVAYVVSRDILNQHRVTRLRLDDGEILGTFGTIGSGPGQMQLPWGVGIGPDGSVYVADRELHRVTKYTFSGGYILDFGSRGSGDGLFEVPVDVAIDQQGRVFVTDFGNHRVQAFSSSGEYLYQWGSYGLDPGQFRYPWAIAVGPSGSVYVTDTGNHRVQVFEFEVSVKQAATWSAVKTILLDRED